MAALQSPDGAPHYDLRLFIAGMGPRSASALSAVKSLCEQELQGRCDLEVIDIYQQPQRAVDEQVVAVPVLVRHRPQPLRRVIGDLSDHAQLLSGLGLAAST
ncbi:MAG TPA: circadian clock KaiB family protein [Burkholderiaceae bacterium]